MDSLSLSINVVYMQSAICAAVSTLDSIAIEHPCAGNERNIFQHLIIIRLYLRTT